MAREGDNAPVTGGGEFVINSQSQMDWRGKKFSNHLLRKSSTTVFRGCGEGSQGVKQASARNGRRRKGQRGEH